MSEARFGRELLVSVIIPVFNSERYIDAALASVLTGRHQTLEIIVVDDGSTDRSSEVVRAAADDRCRVICQQKRGPAAARNVGIAESTGSLLAFLDADDVWLNDKLALQVRALADDPALDMVFGHYVTLGSGGEMAHPLDSNPGYSLGTMLIWRKSFLKVGLLSTGWRVGEFIEWYLRAEDAGLRHAMLPDVVLGRRVHDANMTGRDRNARVDYARIVGIAAARRAVLRSRRL